VIAITTMPEPDGKVRANLQVSLMMPIFCTAGIGGPNTHYSNIRVPIDNESLMFYRLRWSFDPIPQEELNEYMRGGYYYPELVPGTWQTEANVHNDCRRLGQPVHPEQRQPVEELAARRQRREHGLHAVRAARRHVVQRAVRLRQW
jgi:hypothetical protein